MTILFTDVAAINVNRVRGDFRHVDRVNAMVMRNFAIKRLELV